jgi:hypothetical protein
MTDEQLIARARLDVALTPDGRIRNDVSRDPDQPDDLVRWVDSTRYEQHACPDCRTTRMVGGVAFGYRADGTDGFLLIIEHDATCPAHARRPPADCVELFEDGAVVHFAASEAPSNEKE